MLMLDTTYSEEINNKDFSSDHTEEMGNQKFQTPKVLTHVIDDFVVEESETPFQETPSFLNSYQLQMIRKRQMEILAKEKEKEEMLGTSDMMDMYQEDSDFEIDTELLLTAICESCGFSGPRQDFVKPAYKFCSATCARKYRSVRRSRENGIRKPVTNGGRRGGSNRKKGGRHRQTWSNKGRGGSRSRSKEPTPSPFPSDEDDGAERFEDFCEHCNHSSSEQSECSNDSPLPSPVNPVIPFEDSIAKLPSDWTVDDVSTYIASIPDAANFADEFRNQEIDGSALMLIQEEHLVYSMNFTLGRALKLCAQIDKLRSIAA